MKSYNLFHRLSVLFSATTALCFAVLFLTCNRTPVSGCLPAWIICGSTALVISAVIMKKPRTISFIAFMLIVFLMLQAGICFAIYGLFTDISGIILSVIAWAISYCVIFILITKPVTADRLINYLDGNMILLVIGSIFRAADVFPEYLLPYQVCAVCFVLLSLISFRIPAGDHLNRKKILLGIIPAGITAVSAMIAVFFGQTISGSINAVYYGIISIAKYMSAIISSFFSWLFSLFPEADLSPADIPADDVLTLPTGIPDMPEESPIGLLIIAAVVSFGIIAAAVIMLRNRIKLHPHRRTFVFTARRQKKKSSAFLLLFQKICSNIRYAVLSLVYRNTARGIFAAIENRYHLLNKGRAPEETFRQFLDRVAEEHPEASKELSILSCGLDASLYGNDSHWDKASGKQILKTISRIAP